MNDEPDQEPDVAAFGPARERLRQRRLPRATGTPAASTRRPDAGQLTPSRLLVAAGAIIAVLTIMVIAQAVQLSSHPAQVRPGAAIQWGVNGAIADFPVPGTKGAVLQTQYLRVGQGPSFVWLTIAAAGLPGGYDYTAWVGDCVRGRPRRLTGFSAIPDGRTGIWLVSWPRVPGLPGTIQWVTITRAGQARPLGGIRGSFVYSRRLIAIQSGHPVCS